MTKTTYGLWRRGALVACLIGASGSMARGEEAGEGLLVEKLEHGQVNWSEKTVLATGSGAPNLKLPTVAAVRLNAERAAKLDAYRNVLEALKGVQITTTKVGAASLENATVKSEVEGLLKDCKTVDTRYYSDGGVDVVIKCPLDGGLALVLAPPASRKPVPSEGAQSYTGLVVDASGLKFRPLLAPRVVDEAGKELYVQEMAGATALRSQGATGYSVSVDAAKRDPRVGKAPLILKAAQIGQSPGELIVGADEAKKLEGQNLSFLSEAKVVIVTDSP